MNTRHAPRPGQRRGTIFITTLWVSIVLTGIALVMARTMRTESAASGYRLSSTQAAAIEHAAEQWVLAEIEAAPGDAMTVTTTPAEAVPVGEGYFWVLGFNADDPQTRVYNIQDEASKLNINVATSASLLLLPSVTSDFSDCLIDWRTAGETASPQGAKSDYYGSLQPDPYKAKDAPFESVEELLLVKNFDKRALWGYDLNRDGVLDLNEQNTQAVPSVDPSATPGGDSTTGAAAASSATGQLGGGGTVMTTPYDPSQQDAGRGLFPFLTVFTAEPSTSTSGKPLADVNSTNTGAVSQVLTAGLNQSRADSIVASMTAGRPFKNLVDFAFKVNLNSTDFAKVVNQLTCSPPAAAATGTGTGKPAGGTTTPAAPAASGTPKGLVNINTAPRPVIKCLSSQLTDADADQLVAQRAKTDSTTRNTIAWVMDALPQAKAVAIGGAITARSFQYSADIVAVSGDGRAYKRVRVVIDAQKLPAMIVYRKDLTSLGWPLDPAVRDAMRKGQPPPTTSGFNGLASSH